MLARLAAQLQSRATSRNVLLWLALFVLFEVVVLPIAGARITTLSGGVGPLDLSLTMTPARAFGMIAAYGPDGRLIYLIIELTADLIFPAVYSLFLALTLAFLLQRAFPADHPAQRLAVVPLLAALFDYLENAGIVLMLLTHPARLFAAALLPTIFTPLKWLTFGISVVLLIVALGAVLRRRRQSVHT